MLTMASTIHGTYKHAYQHGTHNPYVVAQRNKHMKGTREVSMHNASHTTKSHMHRQYTIHRQYVAQPKLTKIQGWNFGILVFFL